METVYLSCAFLILFTVVVGMISVMKKPDRADKMLAALLLGTAGVAILLVMAAAFGQPNFVDSALVFALLAIVITVAFVRTAWSAGSDQKKGDHDDS